MPPVGVEQSGDPPRWLLFRSSAETPESRWGQQTSAESSVQFSLPLKPELRAVLIADWERLAKQGSKPRPLPRKPPVAAILKAYMDKAKKSKVPSCLLRFRNK